MYDTIVFVDFDGTITLEDTLEGAIRLFASLEEFRSVKEKLETYRTESDTKRSRPAPQRKRPVKSPTR